MGIPKLELQTGGNDTKKRQEKHQIETYVVSKMYTPKRKDEISLRKGDFVTLIEERNGRCYVETVPKESERQERGWIPLVCLQKRVKPNKTPSGTSSSDSPLQKQNHCYWQGAFFWRVKLRLRLNLD